MPPKTRPCKKVCGGENQFMAQQAQETVHKIFKEGREPPWLGASIMQCHN